MSPRGRRESTATTSLRFPGRYFDAETGLHYDRHWHYDPWAACYTSPDPLGLAPAPNQHSYLHDPLTWVDPLGLQGCAVTLYRHVDAEELASIQKTGKFAPGKSGTGKCFAESEDYARQWGMQMNNEGGAVVRAKVARTFADKLHQWDKLDGIGPARFVSPNRIDSLNRSIRGAIDIL